MAINKAWHKEHTMPKNPSMDERVEWHLEHSKKCGCREIPASVKKGDAAKKDEDLRFRM